MSLRHLVIILGDQLDASSAALDDFDPAQDAILMAEVREESDYIRQHKARLVFFFAAMRHFRDAQRAAGRRVIYTELDDPENRGNFFAEFSRHIAAENPLGVKILQPGDWRVAASLQNLRPAPEFCEDRHFYCTAADFAKLTQNRPRPIMENFYRQMRRRERILIAENGEPVGGAWNFDAENRAGIGKAGLPPHQPKPSFAPDALTRQVIAMVEREFPQNPGTLRNFALPVTRAQAQTALHDFVTHRLPLFGRYQDAMLTGEAFLFHAHISGPLNLHLLTPREVVAAALANPANAPLNAVEGFIRQIIGWREFVRGIYWREMPGYADKNVLEASLPMPGFYWTGGSDMRCLDQAISHTIDHAYAHHIERLMVLGLYALLLGIRPYDVHAWHMSMFWDAIDWVSLPNTLGMSQFGDGGMIGTKPYAASGAYINRMSDHCRHCRYDPKQAVGDKACPFTTLYWDFLARHESRFAKNPRMVQQYVNLRRRGDDDITAIRKAAATLKK